MIAYNAAGLDNRFARNTAEEAEQENLISAEEHSAIRTNVPELFYSPRFFARLGFFILTLICLSFCGGFFALITSLDGVGRFVVQTFLLAIGCFAGLEWIIRTRLHLRSGVDDAFLYSAFGLTIGAFYLIKYDMPPLSQSFLFLVISTACVIRYADRLLAIVAFGASLSLVFFTGLKIGPVGKALMPFILMAFAALIYFFINAYSKRKTLRHYAPVFYVLKIAALVCLYAAGNYFVVREANHQMSGNSYGPSAEIPMAWLFWIVTVTLPVLYIWLGLKRKERLFLITGLILVAATAFTIRYYHGFLAPEWALVLSGLSLLFVAIATMKYLKIPKAGITAAKQGNDPLVGLSQLEALLIDETLGQAVPAATPQVMFGGGSGGGGGAGGQF